MLQWQHHHRCFHRRWVLFLISFCLVWDQIEREVYCIHWIPMKNQYLFQNSIWHGPNPELIVKHGDDVYARFDDVCISLLELHFPLSSKSNWRETFWIPISLNWKPAKPSRQPRDASSTIYVYACVYLLHSKMFCANIHGWVNKCTNVKMYTIVRWCNYGYNDSLDTK